MRIDVSGCLRVCSDFGPFFLSSCCIYEVRADLVGSDWRKCSLMVTKVTRFVKRSEPETRNKYRNAAVSRAWVSLQRGWMIASERDNAKHTKKPAAAIVSSVPY